MSNKNKDTNTNINTERRSVVRVTCQTPLTFKVCKEETVSKILQGYTHDVSRDGLRCTIAEKVPLDCTLWLKLDTDALILCEEVERRAVILQHGILGKVIWVEKQDNGHYDVGLQFIVREEKDRIHSK